MKSMKSMKPTKTQLSDSVDFARFRGVCGMSGHTWRLLRDDGTIATHRCTVCGHVARHQYRSTSGL